MPGLPQRVAAGARFVGIGFSLAATVVAALWFGDFLDERWGTSPLFVLLLLVGGLLGFTRRLLWMLRPTGGGRTDRGSGDGAGPA